MAINIGEAWVDITTRDNKLVTGLANAQSKVEKSMNAISAKMASVGKGMTIVGGVITAISVGLIKMASDAKETGSKFAIVFQDVADEAAKSAKNLFDNFGLSINAAKQLLSDTGDLLTGFGFTGKAALDLSTKVNELAVDLASFTNYSGGAEGASAALTKALLGERESVKCLGISILETDVKAKVLEMTQKGMTFETERQAKAYATLLIAQEQSKNAIGDYSRTSEGFANQMRELKARLNDVGVMLGEMILPIATKLINKTVKIVEKIKEWAEAHKPLVEIIVKVGAVLGALAAVGGPILLAVSAFMKMKGAITAVSVAVKALAISSGPIGWLILAVGALYVAWQTNFGGIRDFTIAVVGAVTEALGWLWDKVKWVLEKLGLYKEKTEEINEANQELTKVTKETAEKLKEAGDKAETAVTGVDNLADSMGGLETKTNDAKEALDEFGNKIETFDEWVARLAEETTKANKKMADEAEKAYGKYTDAMQPVEDRLYELSHTEEEVAARNLLKKKESLEESIKAAGLAADKEKAELTKIREWYDQEIGLITTKLEEQQNALIETAKTAETSANTQIAAIREIKNEYGGLIEKIKEVGEAAAKVASKAASEAFLAGTPTIAETGYVPDYLSDNKTPSYVTGTPYVPRTELAMVHKGGKITPANQNTNNNSYSPSIVVNISGDGNASEIREAVEQALQESTRQFNRSGNVLIPGMA